MIMPTKRICSPENNRLFPEGFQLSGIHCGIKSNPEKEDLTIILFRSGPPRHVVSYTENLVRAAPVTLDQARTPSRDIRAVVINSR